MQRLQGVCSGVNATWVIHVHTLTGMSLCAAVLSNMDACLHAHLDCHVLYAAL